MYEENILIGYTKWLVRWALIALLAGLVFVLLISGVSYINNQIKYEIPKSRVTIIAETKDPICKLDDRPINLKISNKSDREIRKISINIRGSKPGRSTIITDWQDADFDYIIPSGKTAEFCLKPSLKSEYQGESVGDLILDPQITYVEFGNKENKNYLKKAIELLIPFLGVALLFAGAMGAYVLFGKMFDKIPDKFVEKTEGGKFLFLLVFNFIFSAFVFSLMPISSAIYSWSVLNEYKDSAEFLGIGVVSLWPWLGVILKAKLAR